MRRRERLGGRRGRESVESGADGALAELGGHEGPVCDFGVSERLG